MQGLEDPIRSLAPTSDAPRMHRATVVFCFFCISRPWELAAVAPNASCLLQKKELRRQGNWSSDHEKTPNQTAEAGDENLQDLLTFAAPVAGEAGIIYTICSSKVMQWFKRRLLRGTGIDNHDLTVVEDVRAFFTSALLVHWLMFIAGWMILLRISLFVAALDLTTWCQHAYALAFWFGTALLISTYIYVMQSEAQAGIWLDGYFMELFLSVENIFLYGIIMISFRVPARQSRKALFITSILQMFFQAILFMGIASWIQKLSFLPYFLGTWLVFVALSSMSEEEEDQFNPESSSLYQSLQRLMGNRLMPVYLSDASILVREEGGLRITMLGTVIGFLLLVMFTMEVDVTLAKIEEIPNHFSAWTSSVMAAFALPELFVVAQELMRRFYLLKPGISLLLFFFGIVLLCHRRFQLPEEIELVIMITIILGSMLLSVLLGYHSRDNKMYRHNSKDGIAGLADLRASDTNSGK